MGYDMYMVRTPDGEEERYRAARQEFDRAVEARNALDLSSGEPEYEAAQEKVSAAYDAMHEAHTSYFRLGMWNMGECRAIMGHFDMLSLTDSPPEVPSLEAYGISSDEYYEYVENTDEAPDPIRRFREAMDAYLSWAPAPVDGIAVHKLGSNEGWIVTTSEIHAALAAYEENRGKDPAFLSQLIEEASWWPQWIDYLTAAANHEGFRVY
ncbi:hypothetical protein [Streptomyces sp. NEAU-YJ-81]|uniref:hypothetical protein n=1 Tax=Streptomyces sp. NEAU-YJ-81 TaxID=2820288 RepID=UPI001ABC7C8F|nr:hypothetical protein [Streptomyces sp. NEAU-YJ-81]MBO3681773.1 hypothetical protein [Streptomyces sp. NEAU-YJ-81]